VRSWPDVFALDWWIGAEDRWRVPAREAAVRQRLVDGAPVVETAMRIPGGDAVQRVYACRAGAAGDVVVMEVENASPVPVALALALRGARGSTLRRIAVDGASVLVDGRVAVWLPHPPSRAARATPGEEPDLEAIVTSGAAGASLPRASRRGPTEAAFVLPLTHRTAVRILLPLDRRRPGRAPAPPAASSLPDAAQVARGWAAHRSGLAQFDIPAGRLADAIAANQSYALLLRADPDRAHRSSLTARRPARPASPEAAAACLDTASATWTWAGPDGDPDPDAVGDFLARVAAFFATPTADGVALVPGWLDGWAGQPVAVSGVRSGRWTASFAVRWHGERPALLWEIVGDGPVRVTAPRLDPSWSSTEPRGEALLAPFAQGAMGAGDSTA
jgi:hypothetical protein